MNNQGDGDDNDELMMELDTDPIMLMMAEKGGDDIKMEDDCLLDDCDDEAHNHNTEQQQQQQQLQQHFQEHRARQVSVSSSTPSMSTSSSSTTAAITPRTTLGLMGRAPVCLYLSCNVDSLSQYQCEIRKNIELFEAIQCDVDSNAKGRNKPIVLGQVGIRCKYCSLVAPSERESGAMYYPTTLEGIYQASQIMANTHILEKCTHIPTSTRQELCELKRNNANKKKKNVVGGSSSSSSSAGKQYWADTANALGVYEAKDGCLRFTPRIGMREYG